MPAFIGKGFRWQIVHQREIEAEGILVPALNEYTRYAVVKPPATPFGSLAFLLIKSREFPSVEP